MQASLAGLLDWSIYPESDKSGREIFPGKCRRGDSFETYDFEILEEGPMATSYA